MIGHVDKPACESQEEPKPVFKTMREIQIEYTMKVLTELCGNRTHTAKALGISIRTLRHWIGTNDLEVPPRTRNYVGPVLGGKTVPKARSVPEVDARQYDPRTGLRLRPGDGQDG